MMENLIKRVLIELDCLLDTRLACVAIISQQHAATLLSKGYFERQSDEFSKVIPIDIEEYKTLYKNRGNNPRVLENAHLTMFTSVSLRTMVKGLMQELIETPYSANFCIEINEYPHTLTSDEKEEFIKALFYTCGVEFPVQFVRLSPKELNPNFIKNRYAMLTMYDYESFIREHGETMCKLPIRDVKVYGPAIFNTKVPTMEELEELQRRQVDPFSEVRLIASPMVDLELIHISHFSVLDIHALANEDEVSTGDQYLMSAFQSSNT